MLRFEGGRLTDSEHWLLDSVEDLPAARFELIDGYYSMRPRVAARIALDGEVEDEELLRQYLESQRGKKVEFIHPQKGEHLSIVKMCIQNANEHLAQMTAGSAGNMPRLRSLRSCSAFPSRRSTLKATIFPTPSAQITLRE